MIYMKEVVRTVEGVQSIIDCEEPLSRSFFLGAQFINSGRLDKGRVTTAISNEEVWACTSVASFGMQRDVEADAREQGMQIEFEEGSFEMMIVAASQAGTYVTAVARGNGIEPRLHNTAHRVEWRARRSVEVVDVRLPMPGGVKVNALADWEEQHPDTIQVG